MLPDSIRANQHIRSWRSMPSQETDLRHVTEAWERAPHPSDDPSIPLYHGEWKNITARCKAEWEVLMAENELKRAQQQAIIEARAEKARGVLDQPIDRCRRY